MGEVTRRYPEASLDEWSVWTPARRNKVITGRWELLIVQGRRPADDGLTVLWCSGVDESPAEGDDVDAGSRTNL